MRRQLAGMLKHFVTNKVFLTKMYEKLDTTKLHYSECTSIASARLGPSLNRGSTVALKTFNTQNKAAFPLPFRSFVIKTLPLC